MNVCCFIGHRDAPECIRPILAAEIERHITELRVRDFLVGCYGGFDRMARAEVIRAKNRRPDVRLFLMIAYLPKEGRAIDQEGCDGAIYPEGMETVPYKLAIPRLNQYMVDDSDYIIAYVAHSWGGAARTLEYAQKQERRGQLIITNIKPIR